MELSITTHYLKTLPQFFRDIVAGIKKAEMRVDDRGFKVGHTLVLEEWDAINGYSGRRLRFMITHILRGQEWGIMKGYAMLSISPLP